MGSDCETKGRKKQSNKNEHEAGSQIENFPREIMFHILSKLPLTSLVRCRHVCRAWRVLVQDPRLVDLCKKRSSTECLVFHSDHPTKNQFFFVEFDAISNADEVKVRKIVTPFCPSLPQLDVVSSCNGLLCLSDSVSNSLYLFNPFTSECIELPRSDQPFRQYYVVFGFGFHPATEKYMVVKIIYYWNRGHRHQLNPRNRHPFLHELPQADVEIFSPGFSQWRNVGQIPYYLDHKPAQVLVSGRLHWETYPNKHCLNRGIVSFDLANERFRKIPTPDSLALCCWDYVALLRGCLCVVVHVNNYEGLEIWVMKEYGVKDSWIKEYNIRRFLPKELKPEVDGSIECLKIAEKRRFNRVLCILMNGEILMEYKCSALVLYDPNNQSFKDVKLLKLPSLFETVIHVCNFDQINIHIGI